MGLFKTFRKQYAVRDVNPNPIQTAEPHRLPPQPRLQPDPVGDLHKLRQQEDDILETYGWVDQGAGIGHVPIERAKELLLQRGLPSRANASPDATEGTHVAASGEATGGRNIRTTPAKPAGGGEK